MLYFIKCSKIKSYSRPIILPSLKLLSSKIWVITVILLVHALQSLKVWGSLHKPIGRCVTSHKSSEWTTKGCKCKSQTKWSWAPKQHVNYVQSYNSRAVIRFILINPVIWEPRYLWDNEYLEWLLSLRLSFVVYFDQKMHACACVRMAEKRFKIIKNILLLSKVQALAIGI